jgi:hypothetical protein
MIGMVISAYGYMEGICITGMGIMLGGLKEAFFTTATMM